MAPHTVIRPVDDAGSDGSRPLVSVLIPAFNAERWLPDTVRSLLSQSWSPLEIIVVDDGSTDATRDVAASFAPAGVRLLRQSNLGAPAARNRALDACTGDYVQYVDADDLLDGDKIERQVRLLQASPAGCVAVGGCIYFEDGADPRSGVRAGGYPELNSDDPVQWLIDLWTPDMGWGMVPLHSWLCPREVIERAGRWDERVVQDDDGEYFTRILLASAGVRWEPEAWCYYRKFTRVKSLSRQSTLAHLDGRLRSVDSKASALLAHAPAASAPRARAVLARQYLDLAFHAYPAFPALVATAEERAAQLSDVTMRHFGHSGIGRVIERTFGWKLARRLSRALHRWVRGVQSHG